MRSIFFCLGLVVGLFLTAQALVSSETQEPHFGGGILKRVANILPRQTVTVTAPECSPSAPPLASTPSSTETVMTSTEPLTSETPTLPPSSMRETSPTPEVPVTPNPTPPVSTESLPPSQSSTTSVTDTAPPPESTSTGLTTSTVAYSSLVPPPTGTNPATSGPTESPPAPTSAGHNNKLEPLFAMAGLGLAALVVI